jgi:hypothetical protein
MKFPLMMAMLFVGAMSLAQAAEYREEALTVPTPFGSLSGTFALPQGSGPWPVALIIAGSGPTDRNGNSKAGLTSNAYAKLAHALAARGLATLRYDKRGVGASTSSQALSDLRFGDFVSDALALTAVLEKDARFSSVAVIGHSEGSLIGILVAQRDPNARAFVSLEGPGRNLADIIDAQVEANPANPPEIVKEVVDIDASLRAGKRVAAVSPLLMPLFNPSVQPYLISEFAYDPAKELAKLAIPVLIVQGSTDIQIGADDASLLAAADPKARVLNVEGMNHVLVDAPPDRAGNIAQYTNPDAALSAAMVEGVSAFLLHPGA